MKKVLIAVILVSFFFNSFAICADSNYEGSNTYSNDFITSQSEEYIDSSSDDGGDIFIAGGSVTTGAVLGYATFFLNDFCCGSVKLFSNLKWLIVVSKKMIFIVNFLGKKKC
jgi:hypothetical protein